MATLRETDRDRQIIDAILAEHPYLGKNRSAAVRVALEYWAADRKMLDNWTAAFESGEAQAARHPDAAAQVPRGKEASDGEPTEQAR